MLEQPAFGQRLRALRVERGLSQTALAGEEMSSGYLSRLESGARRPTQRVREYLAGRLDVLPEAFDTPAVPEHREADGVPASPLARLVAEVVSGPATGRSAESVAGVLAGADDEDAALRWTVLWLLAAAHRQEGKHDAERGVLTELTELAAELAAPMLQARARTALARCLTALGDSPRAREYALAACGVTAVLPPAEEADALQVLVAAEAELGLLGEARTHADQLCELAAEVGGTPLVEALWTAATVRIRQGDHPGAGALLDQALELVDSRGDLTLWFRLHLAAASLHLQVAPPATALARARLEAIAPVLGVVGTDLYEQQLLALRAQLAVEEGQVDEARELLDRLEAQPPLLSFRDRTRTDSLRGRLLILTGDRDGGIRLLQQLAQRAQEAQNVELAADLWRTLARALAGEPTP